MGSSNIFISYRRADTEGYAGRIYDRLVDYFGEKLVFMDVNDIRAGQDFISAIGDQIVDCEIVIVLIGPRWLSITDSMGQQRLDDPHDFVREEVVKALERKALVVPVLVNGAVMPKAEELPAPLKALARRNAFEIRHRHFENDMITLMDELAQHLCEPDEPSGVETHPFIRSRQSKTWIWLLAILGIIILTAGFIGWQKMANPAQATPMQSAADLATKPATATALPPSETPVPTLTPSLTPLPPTATDTPSPSPTPTITLTPSKTPYPAELLDSMGIPMVFVPAGVFTMGTNRRDPWDIVARPAHSVNLPDYYIDKYEVSNVQYARCVDVGTCQAPNLLGSKQRQSYYNNPEYANFPVIYVSWHSAQTFCTWRGGRLPSEAEWEKAARGSDQRAYPWGNEAPDCQRANYWPMGACEGDTVSTRSHPSGVSPYGAFNMSGNVAEWVRDWFQTYPQGDPNASKEFGQTRRVVRGGAYFDGTNNIRLTVRKGLSPDAKQSYLGFRCVMDIEQIP